MPENSINMKMLSLLKEKNSNLRILIFLPLKDLVNLKILVQSPLFEEWLKIGMFLISALMPPERGKRPDTENS